MESEIHGFGIRNPANGIRNPTIIVIPNPAVLVMESGIHGCRIWNPQTWNPESTDMESGTHIVESGIQDSLGLPYMGELEPNIYRSQPVPFAVAMTFGNCYFQGYLLVPTCEQTTCNDTGL